MSAEMERLISEFEKFQAKIKHAEQQFGKVDQMQQALQELEVAAVSADRSVRVVAGPGGAIRDLKLSSEALRQQPDTLAAEIMSTLQRAVAGAAQKQAGIIDQNMGGLLGDTSVSEQVLQNQAEAFGVPVEQLRAQATDAPPAPSPQPSTPPAADDEDYSHGSVFDGGDHTPSTSAPSGGAPGADEFLSNLFNDEDDHR